MNKIQLDLIINSIRSRKDGSLGMSVETPELTTEEKVALMELQGVYLTTLLLPKDTPNAPTIKVDTELNTKTPSQRLRATLFVLWKQKGEQGQFESFYNLYMEKIIDRLKSELE